MTSSSRSPGIPRTLASAARAFFRFGSPRLLALQLGAAVAARSWLGPPSVADVAVLVAVAVYWPLQEWTLHRWVLHAAPLRIGTRAVELPPARAHRAHHDAPLDLAKTLLPTSTIAVLVPVHVAGWLFLAPRQVACTGIVCLGAAALLYEWIHFLTHTGHRPRSRWFSEVKRRHMAHHQRDPQRWFGFTVPKLDDWLGTGDAPRRG